MYVKDPNEKKKILINKTESTGLKHFNNPKAFIEYSNSMQDVYKNIELLPIYPLHFPKFCPMQKQ